jgi:hypothetical protein
MYKQVEKMSESNFKRKAGVERSIFIKIVEKVKGMEEDRKKILGRPLKISYEDQVLMTLEHLKEDTTYFNLSHIYGISEANCYKICKKIGYFLENSGELKLPKQKTLRFKWRV